MFGFGHLALEELKKTKQTIIIKKDKYLIVSSMVKKIFGQDRNNREEMLFSHYRLWRSEVLSHVHGSIRMQMIFPIVLHSFNACFFLFLFCVVLLFQLVRSVAC